MVTHEIPLSLVYESPWSEMATKIFGAPAPTPTPTGHGTVIPNYKVSNSRLAYSLSMN